MVLGASASSPALPGGGGGDASGLVIARPGAEADTPEARALGKRTVSPVGSTAAVEQVAAGAMQLPPQRTDGAPGSVEDRPVPADTEYLIFSQKHPTEVPTLAPLKALKVRPSSTAHWVVEAQATIQHGAASAGADPKEPVAQGGAAKATPTQMGEGAPPSREAEACELDGAKAPSVTEATEVKAPRASKAEATEAGAPRTAEAIAAGAGAPGTTEANVIVAKPLAQEVEMKAAEASVAPLVLGLPLLRGSIREAEVHPISSDDTSQAQEVVNAEVAGFVEQPAPTPGKGGSGLVRV
ncbi:uncharacterized protein [Miscanthus floridulus]|uniref:uncharacterized protein n=1 Tax=Miscanthus floridulus TaxID=154761 RepID=UPI00345993DC